MTKSITFLIGAGFSAPFDIPTMRPFLESFRKEVTRKYPHYVDTLNAHFQKLNDDSDLEALLSNLGKAERLRDGYPLDEELSNKLCEWQDQSRYLRSHLISYIIERCERFDRELATEVLTPFVSKLSANSLIGKINLFTTNYDLIIEHVCDASNIQFADGFGGSNKELVAPWNSVFDSKISFYKLHGSVSYYVDRNEEHNPSFLRLDRGYPLPGPDFRLSRDGHELEPLMVLPTLEKDALGDPYAHLNHLFAQTMSDTSLVVAVGTSLRDNHLVSAMNYNSQNVVVLIVDQDPTNASNRIPNVSNVQLKTCARTFFENSTERLIQLFEKCVDREKQEIKTLVEVFASEEIIKISQILELTAQQRSALNCVSSEEYTHELLGALQELRGIADDKVILAVANRTTPDNPSQVRKAAVACLGSSGNPSSVQHLSKIVNDDESSDVRLEAYLALEDIGTDAALGALKSAKKRWSTDAYFQTNGSG